MGILVASAEGAEEIRDIGFLGDRNRATMIENLQIDDHAILVELERDTSASICERRRQNDFELILAGLADRGRHRAVDAPECEHWYRHIRSFDEHEVYCVVWAAHVGHPVPQLSS